MIGYYKNPILFLKEQQSLQFPNYLRMIGADGNHIYFCCGVYNFFAGPGILAEYFVRNLPVVLQPEISSRN